MLKTVLCIFNQRTILIGSGAVKCYGYTIDKRLNIYVTYT